MRESVTRTITQKGGLLFLANGTDRDAYFVQEFFGTLPKQEKYIVTYTLDPKGEFVHNGTDWTVSTLTRDGGSILYVCFLPDAWAGLRMRRKVSIGRV